MDILRWAGYWVTYAFSRWPYIIIIIVLLLIIYLLLRRLSKK